MFEEARESHHKYDKLMQKSSLLHWWVSPGRAFLFVSSGNDTFPLLPE